MTLMSRVTSVLLSAAVGSSITMTRPSSESARAISTSCWAATPMSATRASGSISTPSIANSSRQRARISRYRMPRESREIGSRPMYTFSPTVRSGKSVNSW